MGLQGEMAQLALYPKILYNLPGWLSPAPTSFEERMNPTSPQVMRLLLLLCALSMALMAAFFLRRRELPLMGYLFWGLLALLIPLIGPFLVIWLQPGKAQVEAPAGDQPRHPHLPAGKDPR